MNRKHIYRFLPVVFLLLMMAPDLGSIAVGAEEPAAAPGPTATPLSEREILLNRRLSFVTERQQLETDIERLNAQIEIAKDQPAKAPVHQASGVRVPKSLKKATRYLVILNFAVLGIVMIIRHKSQEPKP